MVKKASIACAVIVCDVRRAVDMISALLNYSKQ